MSPASPSQADPIPSGRHHVSLALQLILIVSYSSISQPLPLCRYPCLLLSLSVGFSPSMASPGWRLLQPVLSPGFEDDLSMFSLWGQPCHPAPASVTPGDTWGNAVPCEQTGDICMVAAGCVGTCATEVDRGGPLGLDPPQSPLCLVGDCSSGDTGVTTGLQDGQARQRLP